MADETFRQSRKKITPDELEEGTPPQNPFESIRSVQQSVAKELGTSNASLHDSAPFEITGKMPAGLAEALKRRTVAPQVDDDFSFESPPDIPRPQARRPTPDSMVNLTQPSGPDNFQNVIDRLTDFSQWEEFELPSKGKFYSGIPAKIHVRAMTGGEEQILATHRLVKTGQAMDMIYRRCIKEQIPTDQLLSVDRTNLLIYLRGISYTPEYDVEIKCPQCNSKFSHIINLDDLDVTVCPDDFSAESLHGKLPVTNFSYNYRLPTGADELEIANYREKRINQLGDKIEDDTLLYRTALLLVDIEGVTTKSQLSHILKKLPILDVAHLRNEITTPPFGVDTTIEIICPHCGEQFNIDMPLETNFFFPRKKQEKTQA